MIEPLPDLLIEPVVRAALAEDLGRAGDITSAACIDADARLLARFAGRKFGIVSGLACVRHAILAMDPTATFEPAVHDGDPIQAGTVIARVEANARALLAAERTALNLMGHLSGIATLTHAYVEAVKGTNAVITDTRKTTPGLRALEKYAVRCGGGANHRMGLGDAALIKDNHVAAAGGITAAIEAVRAAAPGLPLEVECDRLDQVTEALAAGAGLILLDNMDLAELRAAVALAGRYPAVRLEASGGLRLESARAVAETGVDFVAVGALTHSSPALDLGLDLDL